MNSILSCIPLKEGCLEKFQELIKHTAEHKSAQWKDMFTRYDIHNVKMWHKNIEGKDHAMVYHEVGQEFANKAKDWENSENEFDQWFSEQLSGVYEDGALESAATSLFEMAVDV